jgi:hypothetical protein
MAVMQQHDLRGDAGGTGGFVGLSFSAQQQAALLGLASVVGGFAQAMTQHQPGGNTRTRLQTRNCHRAMRFTIPLLFPDEGSSSSLGLIRSCGVRIALSQ